MRWAVFNGLGAAAWVTGLMYTKGLGGRADLLFASNDHRLLVGASIGIVGLALLVWENLRSAS